MKNWLLAGMAALLLTLGAALAGPFEDGYASYQRGDMAGAVRSFRTAAEQGTPEAAYNLGLMYYSGQGVQKDFGEAFKWYRLAAKEGLSSAQAKLGLMYLLGRGVTQDYSRAHMWSNLANAAGYADGVREAVAAKMTPQQIAVAQKMARECQQRNFKGCDDEQGILAPDVMQFVPLTVILLVGVGIYWFIRRRRNRKFRTSVTSEPATGAITTADASMKVPQAASKRKQSNRDTPWPMLVAAALCPMGYVMDMPSMMLLMRLRFPTWLFMVYILYAFRK